ncbi:MAG TPA: HEAT repeat domain-containing protein, partial [Blastocatellia bacterium]|nr:HEAT repeat domain-containing protein [Blastocatellia bacterium]
MKRFYNQLAAIILTLAVFGAGPLAARGHAQSPAISQVTQQWISDLKSNDPAKRAQAAEQLGYLRTRPSVPDLVGVLSDKDPRVRDAAAFALGEIADQDAANHLSRLLAGDTDPAVRASAAFALGMLEDEKSVSGILDAFDDSAAEVRSSALVALGLMKDQEDVEDIEDMLNDSSFDVRYDAVWALGQIADPESADRLRGALVNIDMLQINQVSREAFREAVQAALDSIQEKTETRSNIAKSRARKSQRPSPDSKSTSWSHPASL